MKILIKTIIDIMDCSEQEAQIILNTISNKSIIKNAIKLALKSEYGLV